MFKRYGVTTLIVLMFLLLVMGCGESKPNVLDAKPNKQETKSESRQVPSSYPLPIPEGWIAHAGKETFSLEEDKYGVRFQAQFQYDGDPQEEGEQYEKLLLDMGFTSERGFSSATENVISFRVFGQIMGAEYAGILRFGFNEQNGDDKVLQSYSHMSFDEMP